MKNWWPFRPSMHACNVHNITCKKGDKSGLGLAFVNVDSRVALELED